MGVSARGIYDWGYVTGRGKCPGGVTGLLPVNIWVQRLDTSDIDRACLNFRGVVLLT